MLLGNGLEKVCEIEGGAVTVLCAGAEPELEPELEPDAGVALWDAPLADETMFEPETDEPGAETALEPDPISAGKTGMVDAPGGSALTRVRSGF